MAGDVCIQAEAAGTVVVDNVRLLCGNREFRQKGTARVKTLRMLILYTTKSRENTTLHRLCFLSDGRCSIAINSLLLFVSWCVDICADFFRVGVFESPCHTVNAG